MIQVHVSGHLKDYTGKRRTFEISCNKAESVIGLINYLDEMFPGIKERILDDRDVIREYVNVFVNGEDVRFKEGECTKLKDKDQVHVLPSVAGG